SPGAGSSSTTLSVSTSIRFSSRLTASPCFLCQLTSVASVTDSGSCGTLTSSLILGLFRTRADRSTRKNHFAAAQFFREGILDQLFLLGVVLRGVADRRRRRHGTACVPKRFIRVDIGTQIRIQPIPRALVLRFFLTPDDFGRLRVARNL